MAGFGSDVALQFDAENAWKHLLQYGHTLISDAISSAWRHHQDRRILCHARVRASTVVNVPQKSFICYYPAWLDNVINGIDP